MSNLLPTTRYSMQSYESQIHDLEENISSQKENILNLKNDLEKGKKGVKTGHVVTACQNLVKNIVEMKSLVESVRLGNKESSNKFKKIVNEVNKTLKSNQEIVKKFVQDNPQLPFNFFKEELEQSLEIPTPISPISQDLLLPQEIEEESDISKFLAFNDKIKQNIVLLKKFEDEFTDTSSFISKNSSLLEDPKNPKMKAVLQQYILGLEKSIGLINQMKKNLSEMIRAGKELDSEDSRYYNIKESETMAREALGYYQNVIASSVPEFRKRLDPKLRTSLEAAIRPLVETKFSENELSIIGQFISGFGPNAPAKLVNKKWSKEQTKMKKKEIEKSYRDEISPNFQSFWDVACSQAELVNHSFSKSSLDALERYGSTIKHRSKSFRGDGKEMKNLEFSESQNQEMLALTQDLRKVKNEVKLYLAEVDPKNVDVKDLDKWVKSKFITSEERSVAYLDISRLISKDSIEKGDKMFMNAQISLSSITHNSKEYFLISCIMIDYLIEKKDWENLNVQLSNVTANMKSMVKRLHKEGAGIDYLVRDLYAKLNRLELKERGNERLTSLQTSLSNLYRCL